MHWRDDQQEASASREYLHREIASLTDGDVIITTNYDTLAEPKTELLKLREYLLTLTSGDPPSALHRRIQRALHGMAQSIALMETIMQPVADYVKSGAMGPFAPVDWLLGQEIGYKYWEALPNFYQDWARIPEFEFAESLIVDGLLRHRPDAGTVAVLGAGACGIVNASAAHFGCTYGMDLSIPSLLLAQPLLEGKSIEVYFKQADWQPVHLASGTSSTGEIRLFAADISRLPFAESSLSAVVTQYIMDLLENPLQVAAEIRRVLKPSGIWINFSVPFAVPGEPTSIVPPGISEVKTLFEPIGLEFIDGRSERFRIWNFDKIYPYGERIEHEVHFLCFRRTAQTPATQSAIRTWRDPIHGNDEWWRQIPRVAPGKEIQIIHRQVLASNSTTDATELKIARTVVPQESMALVEGLFRQIDGKRRLRDVWNELTSRAMEISEVQFCELIQYLANERQVLHLQ